MYAYNKWYLEDARRNLGDMFDYAINVHGMDVDDFWEMFARSKVARGCSGGYAGMRG